MTYLSDLHISWGSRCSDPASRPICCLKELKGCPGHQASSPANKRAPYSSSRGRGQRGSRTRERVVLTVATSSFSPRCGCNTTRGPGRGGAGGEERRRHRGPCLSVGWARQFSLPMPYHPDLYGAVTSFWGMCTPQLILSDFHTREASPLPALVCRGQDVWSEGQRDYSEATESKSVTELALPPDRLAPEPSP